MSAAPEPAPLPVPVKAAPFMLARHPVVPAAPPLAYEAPEGAEAALGDLFEQSGTAWRDLPAGPTADPDEELLLSSHNMLSLLVPEGHGPLPDDAAVSIRWGDGGPQRGPSLFQRVAAMARGGAVARLEPHLAEMDHGMEEPGVYNRRSAGSRY